MSLWRQLRFGLRALLRPGADDRDHRDEVAAFFAEAAAAHRARGLAPAAAARAARLELGGETSATEALRAYGWETLVAGTLADGRYAVRRLRREPAFAALVTLTVALAVGATTAIFSAVYPILIAPLPYPHGERVVTLWEIVQDGTRLETSFATAGELARRSHTLAALALRRGWQPALTGGAQPERLAALRVSADYFRVLGLVAARGRLPAADEDRPNAPRVVVLGDALWRRRFGADPAILGRAIHLDGDAYTVVGILPRGADDVLAPQAALWTPLRYDLSVPQAVGHHLRAIARLRPGVAPAAAQRELAALMPAVRAAVPDAHPAESVRVTSLRAELAGPVTPALLAVSGAVLLLLLLACVNLAHLLLGRGAQRRGELAVRMALGAGRRRIARQLLVESLLLALPGGLLGLALAAAGTRALVALSPLELPRASAIALDPAVLLFGLLLTTLVGVGFGLGPAFAGARGDVRPGLRDRRTVGGDRRGRLVVVEVALALVLLVGCGLLLRSLHRLLGVAPGFEPRGVLTMQVQTSGPRYAEVEANQRFFAAALAAVRALPGVRAAALTSQLPLSGDDDTYGVRFDVPGADGTPAGASVYRYAVSDDYFAAMGIPLLQGRVLDARDGGGAPPVALLGATLARRLFPRGDAVGRRMQMGPYDAPWFTVVGIVGDVRQRALAGEPEDGVYVPAAQWPFPDHVLTLVIRSDGDAAALAPAVRRAVWSVDGEQAIARVAPLDALVAASAAPQRFALALFELFAAIALALGATGIYGVLAAAVARRRGELAVRSALGAAPRELLGGVLRDGLRLTVAGALLGLLVAALATRAVGSLLFGVTRWDPVTYAGVLALLLLVAAAAASIPAWRAARTDPARTLREG